MLKPGAVGLALFTFVLAGLPLWATPSMVTAQVNHASDMTTRGVGNGDRQFLQQAADDGAAEVSLAQLALKQAGSQQVRQLAQQLLDDHMQANRELVTLANLKQDAQAANPPPAANEMQQQLQGLHGGDFDRAYVDDMVQSHQRAVELFAKTARNSTDPDIKHFAQTKLPILQHHLVLARELAGHDR
jgi:putative membrane protein